MSPALHTHVYPLKQLECTLK
ncbi:hypothetical protein OPV22_006080 [Ensete ventricosum]|uniref:Uncharacterized protein n=1 Tax=Ensete ventricosum TaxID=4639 RepID=A0AAV8RME7_ENSVE|nr:hypothetical protein OPV22_006080 [Ensete ventricosum]